MSSSSAVTESGGHAPTTDRSVADDQPRHSPGRWLASALLNIAAFGGVVCLVLAALAFIFDISLIMFRTGSMSPQIPAGSVAVVKQIDSREIAVGDVVTVDRPGTLPVTHRVTSVSADSSGAAERTITMRGDANDVDDPAPYVVTDVRKVIYSIPGLAHPLDAMRRPVVLGAVTLAASVLVTWAFWPRSGGTPKSRSNTKGQHGRRRRSRSARGRRVAGRVGAVLLLGTLGALTPGPAAQATASTTITGDVLRLEVLADEQAMQSLAPGESVPWQVGVWAQAPSSGVISVSLSARVLTGASVVDGGGQAALDVRARSCSQQWHDGVCDGRQREVGLPTEVPWGAGELLLERFDAGAQVWFLFDVALSDSWPGGQVELRVHARGVGDEADVGTGPVAPTPGQPTPGDSRPDDSSPGDSMPGDWMPGDSSTSDALPPGSASDGWMPGTGVQWWPVLVAALSILSGLMISGAARVARAARASQASWWTRS